MRKKHNHSVVEGAEASTSSAYTNKRAKSNSVDNFFPKYPTRHSNENRFARIKFRRQKKLVQSGPLRDATGHIELPLSEEYAMIWHFDLGNSSV